MTDEFKPRMSNAKTPEEARDEIATMIIDASTACYETKGLRRKQALRLGDRLNDIAERISAIQYK